MLEKTSPFHARIFRIYLDFLKISRGWSDDRIEQFLLECGTTKARIADDSTWFDIEFSDRFYNLLLKHTEEKDIAFQAGRFVSSKAYSPIMSHLIRGLLKPSTVYKMVSRFSSHFSKAAMLRVISASENSAIVEAIPIDGFPQPEYACENRRGMLSGVTTTFGLKPADIYEAECIHRGGRLCRYQLRWKEQSQLLPIAAIGAAVIAVAGSTAYTFDWITSLQLSMITLLISIYAKLRLESAQQTKELLEQNEFLDSSIKEIEKKNRQLDVVAKISQLTHAMTTPEALSQTLVKNVCELLDYDRAILLTTDSQRQSLKVSAFYGFDDAMKELLSQTEFHISPENNSGFFVKVVNTKSPLLINDVGSQISKLSPRSQKFAKLLGATSFVAVPLTDSEQNVLGVLAVDYTTSDKRMTIADQDLLMTLADHQSIALHNAEMVDKLEENLQISRQFSKQQQHLRETFQKFVPTDLAQELVNSSEGDLFSKLLTRVRRKPVAIMFCDIFNFSSIADSLSPEHLIEMINTTFGVLEPKVSSFGGYVDKFNGDGFIALFEEPQATLKACSAAKAIVGSLRELNEQLFQKNFDKITLGVGLNYGPVILGNIGSSSRMNFTALGESVNLASRLESHTRQMGPASICVSSSIFNQVRSLPDDIQSTFEFRDLGFVPLKGYKDPVHAYELLSELAKTNQDLPAESTDIRPKSQ